MIKRLLDILAACMLLILGIPIFLIIMVAVRHESRGRVLFKQQRVGYREKRFTIYKFRTMYVDVNPHAVSPVTLDDRRITRVGRVLRRCGIDETPQLWNIVKGEMSFVGPRAQLSYELARFEKDHADLLRKRLRVRPGLTSSWAVMPGKTKHLPSLEMLETDCRYVDHCTMRTDIRIIFQTLGYLLTRGSC